jgi:protein-S-isoprenylcysteine O-methyltransferase Ste14
MLGFPSLYNPPYWMSIWVDDGSVDPVLRSAGLAIIAAGVVGELAVMAHLGFRRSLGCQSDELKKTGLYHVIRNPGVVTALPLIVGTALRWPSWYALGWVLLFLVMIHLMVITEEEHLRNRFGEEYEEYCKKTPRYC